MDVIVDKLESLTLIGVSDVSMVLNMVVREYRLFPVHPEY